MVKPSRAVEIQRKYYTDSADRYDCMHEHEGANDPSITRFVHAFLRMLQARSALDVGAATGRGTSDLKRALPDLFVCGVEPVAALVEQSVKDGNWQRIMFVIAGCLKLDLFIAMSP